MVIEYSLRKEERRDSDRVEAHRRREKEREIYIPSECKREENA